MQCQGKYQFIGFIYLYWINLSLDIVAKYNWKIEASAELMASIGWPARSVPASLASQHWLLPSRQAGAVELWWIVWGADTWLTCVTLAQLSTFLLLGVFGDSNLAPLELPLLLAFEAGMSGQLVLSRNSLSLWLTPPRWLRLSIPVYLASMYGSM